MTGNHFRKVAIIGAAGFAIIGGLGYGFREGIDWYNSGIMEHYAKYTTAQLYTSTPIVVAACLYIGGVMGAISGAPGYRY